MNIIRTFKNITNSLQTAQKPAQYCSMLALCFSMTFTASDSEASPGFSDASSIGYTNASWMSSLPNYMKMSELSAPGTHDTMAYQAHWNPGGFVLTQSMSLSTQLNSGIRVLDIRARHTGNSFAMHHGSYFLNSYFGDGVMAVVNQFLQNNPNETIFMRLKKEHTEEGNSRTFAQTLDNYMITYGSRVYRGTDQNPTLGTLRGKVVIFDSFNGSSSYAPIQYSSLNTQDNWELRDKQDAGTKWGWVHGHLDTANAGSRNTTYMNYLSGVRTTNYTEPTWMPPFFKIHQAITPKGIASPVNETTKNHLTNHASSYSRIGMLMADFPGPGLIERIIDTNIRDYQGFTLHTTTAFAQNQDNMNYAVMPNGDLMGIQKWATGTGTTEVHIATAASNYQSFSLQTGTALHELAASQQVQFLVMPNRDLMVVLKSNTGSGKTEVHILTAASNYTQFGLNVATPLSYSGAETDFTILPNNDLLMVLKYGTGSGMAEVHRLSASTNYTQFNLQTATIQSPIGAEADFTTMPNGDLMMVKRWATGSNSTEVHIMSAASNYSQFVFQRATPLPESAATDHYGVMSNGDLIQIQTSNTGSTTTEVHKLGY